MDFLLKGGKAAGVPGEPLRPQLLLLLQLGLDVRQRLLGGWYRLAGLGLEPEEHRPVSSLLPHLSSDYRQDFSPELLPAALPGTDFLEWGREEGAFLVR